jgi:hypothetical protein
MFDKTTGTRNSSVTAELKKLPEHSQSVEGCGRSRNDMDEEDSGSIMSFGGI